MKIGLFGLSKISDVCIPSKIEDVTIIRPDEIKCLSQEGATPIIKFDILLCSIESIGSQKSIVETVKKLIGLVKINGELCFVLNDSDQPGVTKREYNFWAAARRLGAAEFIRNGSGDFGSISVTTLQALMELPFLGVKFLSDKGQVAKVCKKGLAQIAYRIQSFDDQEFFSLPNIDPISAYVTPGQSLKSLFDLGFQPRAGGPQVEYSAPFNWGKFDNDSNFIFQEHALRVIDPFIREYFETFNETHLLNAMNVAFDWHKNYSSHPTAWGDMATGIRALKISMLLHALSYHTEKKKFFKRFKSLIDLAVIHLETLCDFEKLTKRTNHGYFQIFGGIRLLKLLKTMGLARNADEFAFKTAFNEMFDMHFCADGGHKEHSPEYQYFTSVIILRLSPEEWVIDRENLFAKMICFVDWLTDDQGYLQPIGDTSTLKLGMVPRKRYVESADASIVTSSYEAVVFASPATGYCIVKSFCNHDSLSETFVFYGAKHSNVHKHTDELSLVLTNSEGHILSDPGKYSYDKDEFSKGFRSAQVHSRPWCNIEEENQQVVNQGGFVFFDRFFEGAFEFFGRVLYENYEMVRRVKYTPFSSISCDDQVISSAELPFSTSLFVAKPASSFAMRGDKVTSTDGSLKLIEFRGCFDQKLESFPYSRLYKDQHDGSVITGKVERNSECFGWTVSY